MAERDAGLNDAAWGLEVERRYVVHVRHKLFVAANFFESRKRLDDIGRCAGWILRMVLCVKIDDCAGRHFDEMVLNGAIVD